MKKVGIVLAYLMAILLVAVLTAPPADANVGCCGGGCCAQRYSQPVASPVCAPAACVQVQVVAPPRAPQTCTPACCVPSAPCCAPAACGQEICREGGSEHKVLRWLGQHLRHPFSGCRHCSE
jgi:hypothetical protein